MRESVLFQLDNSREMNNLPRLATLAGVFAFPGPILASVRSTMRSSKGFTLIELLIVVALIAVISAIATASMLSARNSSNEASAVASVRAILSSQAVYNSSQQGYADTLVTLAVACPGSVPFVSADLATNGVTKSGYTFFLAPGAGAVPGPNDCNGTATQTAFYATARPISVGLTGNRGFATSQAGTIWQDTTGTPPPEPFTTAGTVSPIGR